MIVSSECPLALDHISQGVSEIDTNNTNASSMRHLSSLHPVEILALSYGLIENENITTTTTESSTKQ
jgi:hypothetical protein